MDSTSLASSRAKTTNSQNAFETLENVWTGGLSRSCATASQSNRPSCCVWQGTPLQIFDCLVSSFVLRHYLNLSNDTHVFGKQKPFLIPCDCFVRTIESLQRSSAVQEDCSEDFSYTSAAQGSLSCGMPDHEPHALPLLHTRKGLSASSQTAGTVLSGLPLTEDEAARRASISHT